MGTLSFIEHPTHAKELIVVEDEIRLVQKFSIISFVIPPSLHSGIERRLEMLPNPGACFGQSEVEIPGGTMREVVFVSRFVRIPEAMFLGICGGLQQIGCAALFVNQKCVV